MDSLADRLRTLPAFAGLPPADLDRLADRFELETADAEEILIAEGGRDRDLFVLLEGQVAVTNRVRGGVRELARLEPVALFGLLALVDEAPHAASCVARSPVRLARLAAADYEALARSSPRVALAFARALGDQLARDYRRMAERLRGLLAEQPDARPPRPDHACDVAVIGGGPNGLAYASWLKKWRPETHVTVVERHEAPVHKVGESLLSTATRSLIASGLPMPVLRRLFSNKAGIRFWWTDEATDRLRRHLDVVDIEETFQVERRVLEMALQEAARRRGVELMTGTRVDLKASHVDATPHVLACRDAEGERFRIRCDLLCDASGQAAVLARHKGLYRKAPERNQTFTTNSYFAYFRPKRGVDVPLWDEPATRHICFPGGWTWFITLTSWEETPDDNLRALIAYLLDRADEPDEALPSRQELCERFGCTTEQRLSVGVTVRDDLDSAAGLPIAERFGHYVDKYPALAWVMDHYELIEAPYEGKRSPYSSFLSLVHDTTAQAGDGWCLVGDAAVFTNPLFSPGLNFGSGSCYMAARASVDALTRGDLSRAAFVDYERYMRQIYDAVLNETDLYYRAFGHVDAYEWAFMLKLFFGAADVVQRDEVYTETDPYVHDLLNPAFRERVDAARRVMREAEVEGRLPDEAAREVREIVEPFVREILGQPHVRSLGIGEVFTQYTAEGERVAPKPDRRAAFGVDRCPTCTLYLDRTLPACPVCGTPHVPAAEPASA